MYDKKLLQTLLTFISTGIWERRYIISCFFQKSSPRFIVIVLLISERISFIVVPVYVTQTYVIDKTNGTCTYIIIWTSVCIYPIRVPPRSTYVSLMNNMSSS